MENASKALIIAGSILIAVLIVSLGLLIFNNMGDAARRSANMDKQEIANFNSKITPYLGENVSGSQVNALLQYCLSVNISASNSGETNKIITVKKNDSEILNASSKSFTKVETGGKYYTVEGTPDGNGLITLITIKDN